MPTDAIPLETTSPLTGSSRYSVHWIIFLLVVVVGTLGLLHDSWPKVTQKFWNQCAACAQSIESI